MTTNNNLYKSALTVAIVTVVILMIPLVAMQFTDEANWKLGDFIVAGFLLFGTGFSFTLITKKSPNAAYKIGAGIALITGLFLIWSNLAVGIIGSEENPANLMYFGVIIIGIVGAIISRFKPKGMGLTLFTTAFAHALVPIIAMSIWKPEINLGFWKVLVFNAFFVVLFIGSGLLFMHSARKQPSVS